VIKGSFSCEGEILDARDGFGIWDVAHLSLKSLEDDSEILLMDVPMTV
jgi:hypothetical protein